MAIEAMRPPSRNICIPTADALNRVQAAAFLTTLGIPRAPKTLAKEACRGDGPPYFRIGRHTFYDREDLAIWAAGKVSPKVRRARDLKAAQIETRP
jgi:hypothetical protein